MSLGLVKLQKELVLESGEKITFIPLVLEEYLKFIDDFVDIIIEVHKKYPDFDTDKFSIDDLLLVKDILPKILTLSDKVLKKSPDYAKKNFTLFDMTNIIDMFLDVNKLKEVFANLTKTKDIKKKKV